MTDSSSSSSFFSDFGLLLYLEELNKEELNKFKSLLKHEILEPEPCRIPWSEVKKAKREDLANLMNKYYPGERAWEVALKIFDKMNLKDLCTRATAEVNWTARTVRPVDTAAREVPGDQKAPQGSGTGYRTRIKEKFCLLLEKSRLLQESENVCHGLAREGRELLEHLFDEDVRTGEQPQTVVLQGAAGVGKTTLVRMLMLDWAQGSLYQQKFSYVFYLDARGINQLRERSFAQMISKAWPSSEGPIERVLSQPSSLLFVVDGFDELNFAFEEPESVLCKDWTQVHPVSFLMSSLLRKAMLPESSLLVTTKLTACGKLQLVLKSPRSVQLLGMSEKARESYIYQFFEDEWWALQALRSLRSNEMLFSMCRVPLVCWVLCKCLEKQLEKGSDIASLCKTSTALFTCCVSGLLMGVGGGSPGLPSQTQLASLCHLAAGGVWTTTYVFYKENLRKHGLARSDVSIFVDRQILQKDTGYQNCYVFMHLHIQEFFAAMFFMLQDSWGPRDSRLQSFEDWDLLLESSSSKDPHLLQTKCFLFGLLNEERARELEAAFHCKMSLEMKWKMLQWLERLGTREPLLAQLALLELFYHLYETQDEAFISQAMACFQKVVISIRKELDLLVCSFCLRHCRCLRALTLSGAVVFEQRVTRSSRAETGAGGHITHWWQDLCSVLRKNEHLRELELSRSNLDEPAMKIFSQELRHPNCKLQKLLLRFVSFPDACQAVSSALTHSRSLTHLDLKGSEVGDSGVASLCEALEHPDCKLRSLSLESCDLTAVCCLKLSKALIRSRSLLFLSLSTNKLLDDGVRLLCEALAHPRCCLQRLSLESCGLTAAGCQELSLAVGGNDRLTHLCLADNVLGDGGVELLSDALKHPQCALQSLVLRRCHFTSVSSECLSASLLCSRSLTHLDLGSNCLQDAGVQLLCDAFRHPRCGLRDLELMGCVLTGACCLDLASAVVNNPNLQSLDLGHNDLRDDGVQILLEALRHPNCNIEKLGLENCGLTSVCCQDLSCTLSSNQKLIKISLTLNTLGCEGIMKLCEVLRSPECKLQVLGLCQEAYGEEALKLLEAVRGGNPRLVIKQDCNDPEEAGSWWRSL
uniref:NLR family pyrin domain containing 14 n=1 Tax=Catagonus wagneri TaxID=51154 RepID=A0A8C3W107_9CETA